jgi:hypothetical protein
VAWWATNNKQIPEDVLPLAVQDVVRAACAKVLWAPDSVGHDDDVGTSLSGAPSDLPITTRIEGLAGTARPRRTKADRRLGVGGGAGAGGGAGGAVSPSLLAGGPKRPGAALATVASAGGGGGDVGGGGAGGGGARLAPPLRFEPDSAAAMQSRPMAALSLEDLTQHKASLSGGAAAAAAQLSQLADGGSKVSKGREVRQGKARHVGFVRACTGWGGGGSERTGLCLHLCPHCGAPSVSGE